MEAKTWEDTVMGDNMRTTIIDNSYNFETLALNIAKAQAEISYKAGYKHALEGAVIEGGYESVKKQGRKEVVEWGEQPCPHCVGLEDVNNLLGRKVAKRECDEC